MPVIVDSPVFDKQVGQTYTGPEEDWLLAHGYAHRAGYVGPGVSNTGATDVVPAKDPLLKSNREDPDDAYQFGTGTTLAARVKSITPSKGPAAGATVVTIRGDNMVDASSVTFGGTAGTSLVKVSDKEIRVTTPAKAAGSYAVAVVDPSGTTTVANGYTYQ